MNSSLFRDRLLASTMIGGALLLATPTFAQTPATPTTLGPKITSADAAAEDDSTIVVTGSLIKNANLVQSSPIAVVGAEELALRQTNVAEEVLRTIPGIVPSIGSAVNNGNGGASFVNLRGLGTNRNLVLLDGTRLVPAGTVGAVDLNNIPLALVDRLEILTGGASTTYGADAVAGVVNFITKKDFAGVEINASEQISEQGDNNTWRADLTTGANFDDGRGNAVFSIGYQKAKPVYQGDRDFGAFNVSSFTGASGGSGTTVPARFNGIAGANGGAPLGNRQINPATGALLTAAQSQGGAFIPFNFNPYNIYATPFERFNIFGAAHYKIVNDIEVYSQGIYSKNRVTTIIAPSGTFGNALTFPLSNPFLPVAARNQICGAQGLTATQCTAAAAATSPADPNFRTFTSTVGRRFVEAGTRNSEYTTSFFQLKAGMRGPITDTIDFDFFGAYGESENIQRQTGNGLLSRLVNSVNATNPNTCLTGGAACVPINLFGPAGSISQASLNYITGASTSSTTFSRLGQAHAVISGDFGISSPAAENPIGFALGGEYRNYTAGNTSDVSTQTPGEVLGNGAATPDSTGSYNVKEVFVELNAPLIEDKPLAKSLTLQLGGRYSDYSSSGTNYTYKVATTWEPVAGFKLRGNYQKAVRAPNVNELFAPLVTGLDSLSVDPCAGNAPLNNANLRAICIAQGAPAQTIGLIANPSAAQPNATSGGNPNLGVEQARTYTFGVVLAPQALSGFTATVDYYHIRVKNAITSPTIGDQITGCFGSGNPGLAVTPFCTATFRRNPLTGGLDGSTATTPGVLEPLSNLGTILTDGIDVSINYSRNVGFAKLALSFDGNWTHRSKFKATPSSPDRECTGYYSTNCGSLQPKFSFNQRTTLSFGPADISLLWRYIGKERQEPDDIVNGNGAVFSGAYPSAVFAGSGLTVGQFGTADFGRIKAKHYFDLSGRVAVTDQLSLTLTVQNLLNKQPPFVGTGVGTTSYNSGNTYPSTYDAIGRRFAVAAKLRF